MPTPWLVGRWLRGSSLLKPLWLSTSDLAGEATGQALARTLQLLSLWSGDLTMTDRMEDVWKGMQ